MLLRSSTFVSSFGGIFFFSSPFAFRRERREERDFDWEDDDFSSSLVVRVARAGRVLVPRKLLPIADNEETAVLVWREGEVEVVAGVDVRLPGAIFP